MDRIDNFSIEELKEIVDSSSTNTEVLLKLGYTRSGASGKTLRNRCERYGITLPSDREDNVNKKASPMTLEDLTENSTRTTTTIRRFILREQVIPYQCSICHNEGSWEGNPLTLQIDHINGINNDHRLENLRFLCPNCHSQTDTFATRNKRD